MTQRPLRSSLFSASLIASLAVAAAPAQAQEVVFGCFGGAVQTNFQQNILPAFEREHKIKVRYVPGVSTYFVSQLQAQKAKPELDVVCMDDGPQSVARELGLLRGVDEKEAPNLADSIPISRGLDNVGVGYGLLAMGLVYVPEALKKAGIEPPKSWNDLADPRFKGRVAMGSITVTPGLFTLLMLAKANGGDIENIEPGFAKMKEVAKNVAYFGSSDMTKFFQQDEAWVGVWTNSETARFVKRTGFNLQFVYPTEGTPIVMPMLSVVKDSPNPKSAVTLLNYLVGADAQAVFVRESRVGPVNGKIKLSPEDAAAVTYGEAAVASLIRPDWLAINPKRQAWTDRWNREIER